MADIQVGRGEDQFTCIGLGSCVGLCMLDPVARVGGLAHIMLPETFPDRPVDKPGKFANTAVPALVESLKARGAVPTRLRIALVGGAQVFRFGSEGTPRLDIGARNIAAVVRHLEEFDLTVFAQDTGGSNGRTLVMSVATGTIRVRTVTQGERELCKLAV